MKRKVLYGLVLAVVFSLAAPAFAETTIKDVPVDHWAYHAVNTVVSKGYLTVFEDGTFQGTRAVDRYSLASVIARLLEDIEAVSYTHLHLLPGEKGRPGSGQHR